MDAGFGLECVTEEVNVFEPDEFGFAASATPEETLDLVVQSSELLGPRPTEDREVLTESAESIEYIYRRDDGSGDVYLRVDLEGSFWTLYEFMSCGF